MASVDKANERPCVCDRSYLGAVPEGHGGKRSIHDDCSRRKSSYRETSIEDTRALNEQQEATIIEWVVGLTEQSLVPTPGMITTVASKMAGRRLSRTWFAQFSTRHKHMLGSRSFDNLRLEPQESDIGACYAQLRKWCEQFFDIFRQKSIEYSIEIKNIYAMDQTEFVLGRNTRRAHEINVPGHSDSSTIGWNSSKESVNVMATICADGTHLPPTIMYQEQANHKTESWVRCSNYESENTDYDFRSDFQKWKSEKLGLAWLKQIFNPRTREKAQECWRLLLIDDDLPYFNTKFAFRCVELKILVAIYPPGTAHFLQPIGMSSGMFG